MSSLTITADEITLTENLVVNVGGTALTLNGVAAVTDDIDIRINTIIGDVDNNNSGETEGNSQWQDNIIEAVDFSSESNIVMESGNIRSTTTSGLITASAVTSLDPLFEDAVDYQLQYEVNGFSFDSALTAASSFHTNVSSGLPRDLGAWDVDSSGVIDEFLERFLLPYPNQPANLKFIRENVSNLQIGLNGTPDVFNDVSRQTDRIIIDYTSESVLGEVLEFIERQEAERNQTVEISLAPDEEVDFTTAITVNGAHAIGVAVLNVTTTVDFSEV